MSIEENGTYESSPKAKGIKRKVGNYPFDALEVGRSFFVTLSTVNEKNFRSHVVAVARRTGKNLKTILHNEHKCLEVAMLPPLSVVEYVVVESSEEAKAIKDAPNQPDYKKLKEGQSFCVPYEVVGEESIVLSKDRYVVIDHKEYNMFEVYRFRKEQRRVFAPVEPSLQAAAFNVEVKTNEHG